MWGVNNKLLINKKTVMESIKVEKSTKDRFDSIKKEFGYTQDETMTFLLSLYDAYKEDKNAVKALKGNIGTASDGRRNKVKGVTVNDKLRFFVDAIKKHNSMQKGREKNYVYLLNPYFIYKETGINRSRNVVPFLESITAEIEAHNNRYGIDESAMVKPVFQDKDEKRRSNFVGNILKQEGIAHLFNR